MTTASNKMQACLEILELLWVILFEIEVQKSENPFSAEFTWSQINKYKDQSSERFDSEVAFSTMVSNLERLKRPMIYLFVVNL